MFINLGFVLNGHPAQNNDSSDLISKELAREIFQYIAINGKDYNNINSFAEILRQKFFVSNRVGKEIIIQSMELRLVCANWMNCNATTGVDENNEDILNTTEPNSLDELKQDAFFTCNRDLSNYDPIYTVNSLEEAITEFNYVIDLIVIWSKIDGSGDWEYYKIKVLENYDFETLNNQIIQARLNL